MTDTILEPVSRFFTSQGLRLHYLDWGNEGAPTLVLLHGNADHARAWDWTARALADRFHVVALDLRGHGDSEWSPEGSYVTPYHVLDLVTFLDTLGPEPVSIVAHSFGGNLSWQIAAMYPERVRKLVVVDGLGPAPNAIAEWEKIGPVKRTVDWVAKRQDPRALSQKRFASVGEATDRMAKSNPHLSPGQVRHIAAHGVRQHPDGWSWKFDPRVQMFPPHDFAVPCAPYWDAVKIPVLLFYGTTSWTTNPEEDGRAAHFADRRTIVYEGAGHWVHHDRFPDFIAEVQAFL